MKIYMSMMKNLTFPIPLNINYWWNFGSMLGMCLIVQILSGLFLSMHYQPNINMAFNSIIHIHQDINYGWLIHLIHINTASMFFICMYIHIGRNMYYFSYKLKITWILGITILLLSMLTAFLGYVLPWGQMSFWGATVITNLLSSIPYINKILMSWIWGGFNVNNPTLNRFYSLHFITPFMILFMVMLHLLSLHNTGSSNPTGLNSNMYKIPFTPYFMWKDIITIIILIYFILFLCMKWPYFLSDPDNFMPANPFITPIHIQPEWYFLFAYTILRATPTKLGGVIMLLMSIIILMFKSFYNMYMSSSIYYPINKLLFWFFVNWFILLTWMGMNPIEFPFTLLSKILSILYFLYFLITPSLMKNWEYLIFSN